MPTIDLEDELAGLETRISKIEDDIAQRESDIKTKKEEIKDSQVLVKRYEEQQNDVRNNREYESIAKEIEFQNLNIELYEKRIREYTAEVENKKVQLSETKAKHDDRKIDLDAKQAELNSIIEETKKEEDELVSVANAISANIEEHLLDAYHRLRKNARNGLAVVSVERDACGGCFNLCGIFSYTFFV